MDQSRSETKRPQQARSRRTRERILDRAEAVFAAKGFDGASLTSDILEPIGISVGSFYHQFSDKRSVLLALIEERRGTWIDQLGEVFDPAASTTVHAAVRSCLHALLDDVERRPDSWWLHVRELQQPDPEVRRAFEEEWAASIRLLAKVVTSSADVPLSCGSSTLVVLGGVVGGLVRAHLTADAALRERLRTDGVDEAARLIADALGGPTS